ncbi:MAG: cytochrome P450 [Caldilinea sp.]|nr:cytochrome P450 [Caldilinea sp.]
MSASQPKYDLYSHDFKRNPHPTYAAMRARDPVVHHPGLGEGMLIWFVTRYDDVQAVLADNGTFVLDPQMAFDPADPRLAMFANGHPVMDLVNNNLLNKDGENHRRLRAFTPRMVERLRPRVQAIADELLDHVAADGQMDLIDAYAFPLPIIVILEMLGIPPEDRNQFRIWSDAFVTPDFTPGAEERFIRSMTDFTDYLRVLFAQRRAEPRADLVTALLEAEDAGDRLSEQELFSMVVLLIVAGHETTVGLIGNAALTLMQHPEQMQALRNDPALTPLAVEEILRYEGPVERTITRYVARETVLAGRTLRQGDLVIAVVGSANRDAEQFAEADRFDMARNPQRHLGFGHGVHYCLGAPLARLEGEIAVNTLLRRLPGLRLAADPVTLTWRTQPLFHGLVALPVEWDVA